MAAPTVHTNTVVLVEILPRYSAHHFCIVFHLALLRINICDVIIVLPGYHWVVTQNTEFCGARSLLRQKKRVVTCLKIPVVHLSPRFPLLLLVLRRYELYRYQHQVIPVLHTALY